MSILQDASFYGGQLGNSQFARMQDSRWRMIYPAPFFDPIAMQAVMDPKLLIQWSRFFYDWHPIVHAAINGMATYPITDFVFDTKDEKVKQNYEELFDSLNMRDVLVRMGLDYFISGMSASSVLMPFKRMLKCPKCGYAAAVPEAKIKMATTSIQMTCTKCGNLVNPKVEDADVTTIDDIRVILWNPMNLTIDHDEILNHSEFYYSIPNYIKQGILKGETRYLDKYPMYFIDAVHQSKQIKIKNTEMLYMKAPSHTASYVKGWGQPLITPCLKYLFHLLVLIRGQDALAIDQILPWTIISPGQNANLDPAGDIDLNSWQENVRSEYNEWKRNPLRKSIMPVPMQAQIVGANGKSLMLNPEIDAVTNHILAGMGVPNEFVFGGLQWSGASVSLRMLENKFINYRTQMQHVINWVVQKIHNYFGYPLIPVRMQNFKMADDIAQKNILMSLSDAGVISKKTLLNEAFPELNYDEEMKEIEQEQLANIKMQQNVSRASQVAGISMVPGAPGGETQMGGQATPLPEHNPPRAEGANKTI